MVSKVCSNYMFCKPYYVIMDIAQLAYLCRKKYVDAVISEDSDLVVFGCPKTITKLKDDGSAECFTYEDMKNIQIPGFRVDNLSETQFIDMCILSGCDYLPSVRGVGLKGAYDIVSKVPQGNVDLIMRQLNMKRGIGKALLSCILLTMLKPA